MKKEVIELTVLIPCLNEEKTIGTCIEKAFRILHENKIHGEVLVIDNNSTDHSNQIAKEKGARVLRLKEKGYGCAIRYGIKKAYGKYVIMGDADDSYNFLEILPFINHLREGYDFIIGNRFKGMIEKGAMPFSHRYIGTPVISLIANILYRTNIGDYNCGLRGFNRNKMLKLDFKCTGMEFASEMIIKIAKSKYKIKEIPINLYKDGRGRKPHLNTVRDGFRHLHIILKGVFCYEKEDLSFFKK